MPLKTPPDQDIVIVGATGDLAQRKLIPALYNLHVQNLLPAGCDIIGAALPPPDASTEIAAQGEDEDQDQDRFS